ncbi:MAG: HypC/HybG/HupF family hydrogenase formation chaperone [Isosphaeraceae bacterium]
MCSCIARFRPTTVGLPWVRRLWPGVWQCQGADSEASASLMCLAVPGRVRAVFESGGTPISKVDFGGVIKDVCLAFLPDLAVGD